MSTIQLPGLLSGIDTNTLISQLMAIEKRTLTIYQNRLYAWQDKQTALNTLETNLSSLKTAVKALSDDQQLHCFSATSSDEDIMTAEASYNAFEGNHNVTVNRLASAERWVHTEGLEYVEDAVGAGTFIYSYNHKESSITTTDSTTLEELANLINNDANNPGVTASILYFNKKYHLMLNGNDAGSDYSISVNSSNTEVWQTGSEFTQDGNNATLSTKITDLDQFSGTLSGNERILITGNKHDGTGVDTYMSITGNTKLSHVIQEINDAFGGTATATLENGKIVLTDNTCGTSQMTLTLGYDDPDQNSSLNIPAIAESTHGGEVSDILDGFAAADFTETQSAQDSEIRVDGYPMPKAGVAEVQTLAITAPATAGTFRLTYGGQITDAIAYNADTATIQAALEALSNVEAGDITVSGNRLDESGTMSFTFRDTAGDTNMISIDSSGLTPSQASNYVMAEQTKGDNYGWIRRSSNTIDDVISGVTLHLHSTGSAEVNLTRNIQAVKDKINSMVTAYNTAVNFIKENTKYDTVNKKAGVLMGDYVVSTINSALSRPLISQTNGFIQDIDTFLTPAHIGFSLDSDGLLNFDANVFDEAIAKDYTGTLALIGANKTGSSDSSVVKFYSADSKYTTAGSYDVRLNIASGVITNPQIKLSTESTWRDATVNGNIITGNSTFDENGNPVYPENGLQLSIDLSQDVVDYTATVRVKQGFAGALEDLLNKMLDTTTGSVNIDQKQIEDNINALNDRIDTEQTRLTKKEDLLVARFARLESQLALIQAQMSALGISSSA